MPAVSSAQVAVRSTSLWSRFPSLREMATRILRAAGVVRSSSAPLLPDIPTYLDPPFSLCRTLIDSDSRRAFALRKFEEFRLSRSAQRVTSSSSAPDPRRLLLSAPPVSVASAASSLGLSAPSTPAALSIPVATRAPVASVIVEAPAILGVPPETASVAAAASSLGLSAPSTPAALSIPVATGARAASVAIPLTAPANPPPARPPSYWQRISSNVDRVWRRVMIRDIASVEAPPLDPLVRNISIAVITSFVLSSCSLRILGGDQDRTYNHGLVKNIIDDVERGVSFYESLNARGALNYRQNLFAEFLIKRYYEGNRILPTIIERLLARGFEGAHRLTHEDVFQENFLYSLRYINGFLMAHLEGTLRFVQQPNVDPFQTEVATALGNWEQEGHLRLRRFVINQFFGHIFSQIPDFTYFGYFTSSKWKIVHYFGRVAEHYIGRLISRISILFLKKLAEHQAQHLNGHSVIAYLRRNEAQLINFCHSVLDEINRGLDLHQARQLPAPSLTKQFGRGVSSLASYLLPGLITRPEDLWEPEDPVVVVAPEEPALVLAARREREARVDLIRREIDGLIWRTLRVLAVEATPLSGPRDGRAEGEPYLTQQEMINRDQQNLAQAYDSVALLDRQIHHLLQRLHLQEEGDPIISRAHVNLIFTHLTRFLNREAITELALPFFLNTNRRDPIRRLPLRTAVETTVRRVEELIPQRVIGGLVPARCLAAHHPRATARLASAASRAVSIAQRMRRVENPIQPIPADQIPDLPGVLAKISLCFSDGLANLARNHPGIWDALIFGSISGANVIVSPIPTPPTAEPVA